MAKATLLRNFYSNRANAFYPKGQEVEVTDELAAANKPEDGVEGFSYYFTPKAKGSKSKDE